jgi:DHA3 family macrolide efflux protein-like MFS transporter
LIKTTINFEYRLYLAMAINSLGSWLTFLAIALILNNNYGSEHVALSFLIQSLPPILISPYICNFISGRHKTKIYFLINLLLAVNVFIASFGDTVFQIYVYMILASIFGAIQRPLMDSLIPEWVDKSDLVKVNTRVGSINSIMLMFAPPLGGLISSLFSSKFLMIFDSITFLVSSLIIISQLKITTHLDLKPKVKVKFFSIKEKLFNVFLRRHLTIWYWFLLFGGVFNGIEFYLFKSYQFTSQQIGLALGAWGFGGLISFLTVKNQSRVRIQFLSVLYFTSFITFLFINNFNCILISFLMGGVSSGLLAGKVRTLIQNSIINEDSLEVWGLVSSRMAFINCICYGGSALFIKSGDEHLIKGAALIVSISFLITICRKNQTT